MYLEQGENYNTHLEVLLYRRCPLSEITTFSPEGFHGVIQVGDNSVAVCDECVVKLSMRWPCLSSSFAGRVGAGIEASDEERLSVDGFSFTVRSPHRILNDDSQSVESISKHSYAKVRTIRRVENITRHRTFKLDSKWTGQTFKSPFPAVPESINFLSERKGHLFMNIV